MNEIPVVHVDWGIEGLQFALQQQRIVIIVDALRFSSAVVTAVANGFTIIPAPDREKGVQLAQTMGIELAGISKQSRFSISPLSFLTDELVGDTRVVLASPNGAACAAMVRERDRAYIGCFLNARSIAEYVTTEAMKSHSDVAIVAAGEQRAVDTGERIVYVLKEAHRVFAVEDYLAAGAIVSYSQLLKTPEAIVCERAFDATRKDLKDIVWHSFSGQYLVQNNLSEDIVHSVQLNAYSVVPCVHDGAIADINPQ